MLTGATVVTDKTDRQTQCHSVTTSEVTDQGFTKDLNDDILQTGTFM